jgi:hypothetical protein
MITTCTTNQLNAVDLQTQRPLVLPFVEGRQGNRQMSPHRLKQDAGSLSIMGDIASRLKGIYQVYKMPWTSGHSDHGRALPCGAIGPTETLDSSRKHPHNVNGFVIVAHESTTE